MDSQSKRVIEFKGLLSGNHECFAFAVDKETFKLLTGKDPDEFDVNDFHKGKFNVSPFDIFMEHLNVTDEDYPMKIIIGVSG